MNNGNGTDVITRGKEEKMSEYNRILLYIMRIYWS